MQLRLVPTLALTAVALVAAVGLLPGAAGAKSSSMLRISASLICSDGVVVNSKAWRDQLRPASLSSSPISFKSSRPFS